MQLLLKQLTHSLKRQLAPVYLISGDIPLLIHEARDAIRQALLQANYPVHERYTVGNNFSWDQLDYLSRSLRLFAEKTVLEISYAANKWEQKASHAVIQYCKNPAPDKILILITERLNQTEKKTAWYQAIDQIGVVVTIWPITSGELPRWIQNRSQNTGLRMDASAIALLAELTEGNLSATAQALEKLRLLYSESNIGTTEVARAIFDHARFNIFDLSQAILQGNTATTLRIMTYLRAEGTEPILVLWLLIRELRELLKLALDRDKSISGQQRTPYKIALSRLSFIQLQQLLKSAGQIDKMIKGILSMPGGKEASSQRVWNELIQLSLKLAGAPLALERFHE